MIGSAFFLIVVTLWYFASYYFPPYLLPPPQDVLKVLWEDKDLLLGHTSHTLITASIGLFLSFILGLGMMIISYFIPKIQSVFLRVLEIFQMIPSAVLFPLFIAWFGLNIVPKLIMVILVCGFPLTQLLLNSLQESLHKYSFIKVFSVSTFNEFLWVHLPYSIPRALEGIQLGISYAFMMVILGEFMGSEKGMGVYIIRAQSAYRMDRLIGVTLLGILMTYSALLSTRWLHRLFFHREHSIE